MILIGSRALSIRLGSAMRRKPLDFDFICTKEEFDQWMEKESHKVNPTKVYELPEYSKWIVEGSTNVEFEIIKSGSSNELLLDLIDHEWLKTPFGLIPPTDILLSIKESHKYKKFHLDSSGFWKTAIDIYTMRQLGAKIRPEYEAFYKLREQESYAGQKHPKLNVSKEDFFKDDGIQYRYQHDDLHTAIMIGDRPAYTNYLKDNEPVLTDKKKFFACDEFVRMCGVCEEAGTLALERSQIPNDFNINPIDSWRFALSKTASSITSGYFRAYCYDHLFDALKMYPTYCSNYVDRFKEALSAGKVRPFSGSRY
jgi:hypothetical protein